MKIRSSCIWAALLALVSFFTSACGGKTTQIIEGTKCVPAPPSSDLIAFDLAEAEAYKALCYSDAEEARETCYETSGTEENCQQQYGRSTKSCDYFTAWRANENALHECGAAFYIIPENISPDEYNVTVDLDSDTDGDGIKNWEERIMGYNPCSPTSFGYCEDGQPWADADLDFDDDGIPNGRDDAPRCNWEDPLYSSNCI